MATRTRKDSKDTWDSGSLDPTDRSKGSGVASTNSFLFFKRCVSHFCMLWYVKKAKALQKIAPTIGTISWQQRFKVVIQIQEISISTDAFILDNVIDYIITKYKSKGSL